MTNWGPFIHECMDSVPTRYYHFLNNAVQKYYYTVKDAWTDVQCSTFNILGISATIYINIHAQKGSLFLIL